MLLLFVVGVGVGLTPFFRNRIGERFGDLPFPELLVAAISLSGDGEDPAPVAELRLEVERPTVVSKWRNL